MQTTLHNLAYAPGLPPMADTAVSIAVVCGDVNHDGSVLSGDISAVKAASGESLDATATMFRRDLTVSGAIDGSDVNFVKTLSGNTAPACP